MIYYFHGATLGDTWRVRATGGDPEPAPVISGPPGPTPLWGDGDILPSGRAAIMTRFPEGNAGAGAASIVAVDFETGEVKPLGQGADPHYMEQGFLVWGDRTGALMAAPFDPEALDITGPSVQMAEGLLLDVSAEMHYTVADDGTLAYRLGGSAGASGGLMWVGRDGSRTPASDLEVGLTVGLWDATSLSPDGSRVALTLADGLNSNVWVENLSDDSPPTRVSFDGAFNVRPRWTPDGRSLTYVSNRGGQGAPTQLWKQAVDGTGTSERVVVLDREVEEGFFSPDGEWVVFRAGGTTTDRDIYALRPGVDSVPVPLAATPANERAPSLSPDGRWLAYMSDETGRDEIFVRPFPNVGDGKWQVSSGGGISPLWGRTGRELFYLGSSNMMRAVRYDVSSGSFAIGGVEDLFTLEGQLITGTQHLAYDISLDDERFLMLSVAGGRSGLVWVHNWLQELEERVGEGRR
jgi:serine/threonine-protein kinase